MPDFFVTFLYYVFNSSFLSIYRGLDTRLCCGLLLAHGHLECTVEEAMPPHFYVWQMNAWYSLVILSWASQPLSKYYYCMNVLILIRHCCIYIIFALWRHSRETAIPTLVTEDLQYMVADIGNLYFSRWEFWRTLHRRCAKVYKYGSNDALAEDDPIDLGQSWQGHDVIRNAWCERLRGKVLLQEPFKLWLRSLLWLCWPHGWKLSGQGKEKSSQRLQRMSFALKTMGGATVGSAITTAGLSWITRACGSG